MAEQHFGRAYEGKPPASVTPPGASIERHEAGAEAMPFPDGSFDVALSQMGLQFMPDRHAALGEMHRVLVPGGRLVLELRMVVAAGRSEA